MTPEIKKQLILELLSSDSPATPKSPPKKTEPAYQGARTDYAWWDVFVFRFQGFILGFLACFALFAALSIGVK
jgi:hypothetical protein